MLAKFHGNILNLGENIAKSFRGLLFFTHTVVPSYALTSNADSNLCTAALNRAAVSRSALLYYAARVQRRRHDSYDA